MNIWKQGLVFVVLLAAVGVVRSQNGAGAAGTAPTEPSAASKTELRLSLVRPAGPPLEVGQRVQPPLNVAFRRAPPRSRIYVHILAMHGDQWIAPGGAEMSATDPTFNFSGFFVDGDQSPFKIAASNYPITLGIKNDVIAKALGQFSGKAASAEMASCVSGNSKGYRLSLAHLTSILRPDSVESVTLGFTVPDYGQYFDALDIVPLVLTHNDDGSQSVSYVGAQSTSVRLRVTPNQPEPLPEPAVAAESIPGAATITSFVPSNVVLATGARNTLGVRINFRDLKPGTALYVLPIPIRGNRYVLGALTAELDALRRSGPPEFTNAPAGSGNNASPNSRSIRVEVLGEEQIEAAFVSVVGTGGNGNVEAQVVLTPPAYARRYDRVHLVPVLMVPTDDGLRYLIDSRKLIGPKLLVSDG